MIPKKRFGISKNFRPILKSLGKASVKSPVFLCHLSLRVLNVNFAAGLQFCFFGDGGKDHQCILAIHCSYFNFFFNVIIIK